MSDWKTRAVTADALAPPPDDTGATDWRSRATVAEAPAAAPAPAQYEPSLLPITRVPKGQGNFGMSEHKLVVPGVLKDVYNQIIEGGEAARGNRSLEQMKQIAPGAAMLGLGEPAFAAAKEAAPMVGAAAKDALELAKGVPAVASTAIKAIPSEVAPTAAKVYQGSKAAFKVVDDSGVRVSPEPFQEFADQIGGNLKGYNPKLPSRAPETNAVLKELKNYANEEDTIKFSELADMRSNIGDSIYDVGTKKNDKRLLGQIADQFDDFMTNLKPEHLDVGEEGDLNKANSALGEAKDLWNKSSKMSDIEQIMKTAAGKKYPDRIIQQKFNQITSNPRKMARFSPDEQQLITKIANGGALDSVAKLLAPSGDRVGLIKAWIGATSGAAAGSALFGLPGVVGGAIAPAVGLGAKAITEAGRRNAVQSLQDTIALGRSPNSYFQRLAAERARQRALAAGTP